jgi:hypothetical protein
MSYTIHMYHVEEEKVSQVPMWAIVYNNKFSCFHHIQFVHMIRSSVSGWYTV